jgi:hypothetical protein
MIIFDHIPSITFIAIVSVDRDVLASDRSRDRSETRHAVRVERET